MTRQYHTILKPLKEKFPFYAVLIKDHLLQSILSSFFEIVTYFEIVT